MTLRSKTKKCRRCRTEFVPRVEWQKYCKDQCREASRYEEKAKMIREYKRMMEEKMDQASR